MTELAQPADRFHPAEDFFDAFPRHRPDRVAGMARGPAIEGATLCLQGDMGRGVERAQGLDEAARVVAFVAADGDAPAWQTRDELVAASRSPVPVAGTTHASTTRPWRFSISTSPR